MDMLQRYLHAVEFWLPSEQRRDIIAEISEDLNSQIEDQQTALGRKLNRTELEALLKQRGRPLLVANRYRPQQSLIGPLLFPAYLFVLKIVALCYVLPWLIVFTVVHRVQHPQLNWGSTILATWAAIWTVAFIAAAVVTLTFAILQWSDTRTHFLEQWDPRKLPPVRDPNKIERYNSIIELVVNFAFILWWIAYAWSPVILDGPNFRLSLAPVRLYFFWGYLAIALFNIALAFVNLQHPYWTSLRTSLRLATDLAGGLLFCWLLKANIIASISIANLHKTPPTAIRDAINLWLGRGFPIALIIVVIVAATDVFRIVRVTKKGATAFTSGVAPSRV